MLNKFYASEAMLKEAKRRYSPATLQSRETACVRQLSTVRISASHFERAPLSMRMGIWFTQKSNTNLLTNSVNSKKCLGQFADMVTGVV